MDEIKLNNSLDLIFLKAKIFFDLNAERRLIAFANAFNLKYEVFFDEQCY